MRDLLDYVVLGFVTLLFLFGLWCAFMAAPVVSPCVSAFSILFLTRSFLRAFRSYNCAG